MSTTYVEYPASAGGSGGGTFTPVAQTPWVRPAEWKALSPWTAANNGIQFLVHLWPDGFNAIGFYLNGLGTVDVDWGDGTVETAQSMNAAFEHFYDFSTLPNADYTAEGAKQCIVTITPTVSGTDKIYWFSADETYRPTGFNNTKYNSSVVDFQCSLPDNVSGTGFSSSSSIDDPAWRSLKQYTMHNGGNGGFGQYAFGNMHALRKVTLPSLPGATSLAYLFYGCSALDDVTIDLSGIASLEYLFWGCAALKTIPPQDLSSCTMCDYMFDGCKSLEEIPDITWPTTINSFYRVFANCIGLREIPDDIVWPTPTVSSAPFYGCEALTKVPIIKAPSMVQYFSATAVQEVTLDMSGITNLAGFFQNCFSLQKVTFTNVSTTALSYADMFYGCHSLQEVVVDNPIKFTDGNDMFRNCYSLKELPSLDCSVATSVWYAFAGCRALTRVDGLVFNLCTNFSYAFEYCYGLEQVDFTINDPGAAVNYAGMFRYCYGLQQVNVDFSMASTSSWYTSTFQFCVSLKTPYRFGEAPSFSHSLASMNLQAADLDAVYTALPVVVGQTITVSGNPGVTGDDPTIATAKGWTVTG